MTPGAVRPAGGADLAAVIAIARDEDNLALSAEAYEQLQAGMASGAGLLLVTECAGAVRAFSACSRVLDEATLLAVAVAEGWRGRGIGRALLVETLAALAAAGTRRLLLEVRAGNGPALALYRAAGFLEDGRRRDYYPGRGVLGRDDAILMSHSLE